MKIVSIHQLDPKSVQRFFSEHRGSSTMVVSIGIYEWSTLNGFAALNHCGDIAGLLTYIMKEAVCKIVSLDSREEGKGIGTALLTTLEMFAQKQGCRRMELITTCGFIKTEEIRLFKYFPIL
ncbi:acetyltransferase family protein [Anoxybacillus sp. B7M1]|uniref:GNAT family N-acetyltransferase n=1 Tax=unclassified Anoxybacillus TaxID=2639704 RepID=UPI0007B5C637|nr:acetyltransferase family protein [Anoxybacillus sp. B2M1]ANB65626.1 acetyltransferase family protein [Anoxybacillus sp. B7M1]